MITPTFEKSSGLKGQFNIANVTNAVKDVMHHHFSLREAGRRWNVNLCALSCYVKQAKTEGKGFTTDKKTMKTKLVGIEVFILDFRNGCSQKTMLKLLIIFNTGKYPL